MNPYFQDVNITIYNADVMEGLAQIPDESVQCYVTSPPYWGLRDYGVAGQLGQEKTPKEYIEKMVSVFREVRRVLKNDGILWLNMGDMYIGGGRGGHGEKQKSNKGSLVKSSLTPKNLKNKDLLGLPWMLAFALRDDGWYLRNDIIWSKPNPMPESVTDRCTRAHEYIFHFTKSAKYYYDADAIRTAPKDFDNAQRVPAGWDTGKGGHGRFHRAGRADKQRGHSREHAGFNGRWDGMTKEEQQKNGANKRTVWTVATKGFPDAHFATFPPELIEPCILTGSQAGDTILDFFWGSGTTGEVAIKHQRKVIGIELNEEYCKLSLKRFNQKTLNF